MMHIFAKRTVRNAIEHQRFYRTMVGIILGAASAIGAYEYVDNSSVEPRAANVELNRRAGAAFGEISRNYYDPKISNAHNIRFYNQPPDVVLRGLEDTKKAVDKNKAFLAERGHLDKLPENQLELAIKNVSYYASVWPDDADDWYAYLYAGDVAKPPSTYAQELKTFYETADNMRKNLEGTHSGKAMRNVWSALAAYSGTVFGWRGYPYINRKLRNAYRRMITEEQYNDTIERLRALD